MKFAALCAFVLAMMASQGSSGATLLPDGSLRAPGDLTVVQEGGTLYEFLDLTATLNVHVNDAIAAFQSDGFSWADASDMTVLLSAFNIAYSINAGDISHLLPADGTSWTPDTFASATSSFLNHLGSDPLNNISSAGFINDLPVAGRSTYLVVNPPNGIAQISNEQTLFQAAGLGTFLVRTEPVVSAVPEVSTVQTLSFGLLLLILYAPLHSARRRRCCEAGVR